MDKEKPCFEDSDADEPPAKRSKHPETSNMADTSSKDHPVSAGSSSIEEMSKPSASKDAISLEIIDEEKSPLSNTVLDPTASSLDLNSTMDLINLGLDNTIHSTPSEIRDSFGEVIIVDDLDSSASIILTPPITPIEICISSDDEDYLAKEGKHEKEDDDKKLVKSELDHRLKDEPIILERGTPKSVSVVNPFALTNKNRMVPNPFASTGNTPSVPKSFASRSGTGLNSITIYVSSDEDEPLETTNQLGKGDDNKMVIEDESDQHPRESTSAQVAQSSTDSIVPQNPMVLTSQAELLSNPLSLSNPEVEVLENTEGHKMLVDDEPVHPPVEPMTLEVVAAASAQSGSEILSLPNLLDSTTDTTPFPNSSASTTESLIIPNPLSSTNDYVPFANRLVSTSETGVDPNILGSTSGTEVDPNLLDFINETQVDSNLFASTSRSEVHSNLLVSTNESELDPNLLAFIDNLFTSTNGTQLDPNLLASTGATEVDPNLLPSGNGTQLDPNLLASTNGTEIDPNLLASTNGTQLDPNVLASTNGAQLDPNLLASANATEVDPNLLPLTNGTQLDPNVLTSTNGAQLDPNLLASANATEVNPNLLPSTNGAQLDPNPLASTNDSDVDPNLMASMGETEVDPNLLAPMDLNESVPNPLTPRSILDDCEFDDPFETPGLIECSGSNNILPVLSADDVIEAIGDDAQ